MNTPGEWKVFIEKSPATFEAKVWLVHTYGSDREVANVDPNTSYLKMTKFREGDTVFPLMTVPASAIQAISDAFTETVPPTKKERIEAELEATKFHLQDMRELVFGGKPTKVPMKIVVDSCCVAGGHKYIKDLDNPGYKKCSNGCGSIITDTKGKK